MAGQGPDSSSNTKTPAFKSEESAWRVVSAETSVAWLGPERLMSALSQALTFVQDWDGGQRGPCRPGHRHDC